MGGALSRSRESLNLLADLEDEQEEARLKGEAGGAFTSAKLKGGSSDEDDSDGEIKPKMGALGRSRESLNLLADLEDEEKPKMNKLYRSVESLNLLNDLDAEGDGAVLVGRRGWWCRIVLPRAALGLAEWT